LHFWKSEIFLRRGLDRGVLGRVVICPSGKFIKSGKRENMAQVGVSAEIDRALHRTVLKTARCG